MINKPELVEKVAAEMGGTKKQAEDAVNAVFDVLTTSLIEGQDVRIPKFGTFKVKTTAARTGRNPSTGAAVEIPAGKKLAFQVASDLKGAL